MKEPTPEQIKKVLTDNARKAGLALRVKYPEKDKDGKLIYFRNLRKNKKK